MNTSSHFFFLSLILIWFISLTVFGANTIHPDEKKALEDIAKSLGKKNWNFDIDPCSNKSNWFINAANKVTCNCSVGSDNFCHVVEISLKEQNLAGTLPLEFNRLRYLQTIDLTRNYLNGSIPKEWGSMMNINRISLTSNRLTGSIPVEIANLSTLQILELWNNQMSGNLPPELGNLTQIQALRISSNNFTGELPMTLAKLTELKDFRIEDNQFSGKIPDYIQNWTSIKKLMIQGSGLSGPIPSAISLLRNLTDLIISDLKGSEHAPLPQLNNMILILRNCNINGTLPKYLGNMTTLKHLDLSFNNLSGEIPITYATKNRLEYIFLTGNNLTGQVPSWRKNVHIDLSYNNFSISQGNQFCKDENMNIFSPSWARNDIGTVSCLSFECPKPANSLYINCGGKQAIVNGKSYDGDSDSSGSARFHCSPTGNWAFSTTGIFIDGGQFGKTYFPQNHSPQNITKLTMEDAELYMDARVSPISLTYYGYCLANGSYTVYLNFAEIMFTDDQTYRSLGRRVFDIYLQGQQVQKDFNIAEEAGGVGKKVVRQFNVDVTSNTLEIRLYWAGKGTQYLPNRSVYGPLISAISVKSGSHSGSMSAGDVVGIVIAATIVIILIFGILWWKGCFGKKNYLTRGPHEHQIRLDWSTPKVVHRDIKATNVLLDANLDPKISDFGLAKLDEEDKTHISTRIAGTYGYMAPEYAMHGYLTDKADVYSFGIVALEIVSGRSNSMYQSKEEAFYLLEWAHLLKESGDLMELIDRRLGSDFNKKEAMVMINVALLCTNVTSNLRSSMSSVVSMLEGRNVVQEFVSDSNEVIGKQKLEVMRQYYSQMEVIDGKCTTSSSPPIDSS